jgi:hypothetical protein
MIWTWLKLTQRTGTGPTRVETEWPCPQMLRGLPHNYAAHTDKRGFID